MARRARRRSPTPVAEIPAVAFGGAIGATLRWTIEGMWVGVTPWPAAAPIVEPILLVNVLGAGALGALTARLERSTPHPLIRPFLAAGVLGAFTTWSGLVARTTSVGGSHGASAALLGLAVSLAAGLWAFSLGERIVERVG